MAINKLFRSEMHALAENCALESWLRETILLKDDLEKLVRGKAENGQFSTLLPSQIFEKSPVNNYEKIFNKYKELIEKLIEDTGLKAEDFVYETDEKEVPEEHYFCCKIVW